MGIFLAPWLRVRGIEPAATPAIVGDKSRVANATDGIRRRKRFSEASADEDGTTLREKIPPWEYQQTRCPEETTCSEPCLH